MNIRMNEQILILVMAYFKIIYNPLAVVYIDIKINIRLYSQTFNAEHSVPPKTHS